MTTAVASQLHATLFFHLNLNYSSIEVRNRAEVVRRCYRPLLGLLEEVPELVLALECSGHTLERIARLDSGWIPRLRTLAEAGRVEFVGSGDTQLIGPLVPAAVNRWNQSLGRALYRQHLGLAPRVALVNEMAFSQGVVEAYLDAGYECLITEWNNPRRAHPEWEEEWRYRHAATASPTGRSIGVLWADALLFQLFQRVVAGQCEIEEYLDALLARAAEHLRHVFLYASDAEVFDYRPGRYTAEPRARGSAQPSEWERMAVVLRGLLARGIRFTTPGRVLDEPELASGVTLRLAEASDPIPVKKQPKYNVTRWAVSGWDDVGLNARCFARARELEERGGSPRDWQLLCRAFGSDLRTHLTARRWRRLLRALPPALPRARSKADERCLSRADVQRSGRRLTVTTDGVRASFLPERGLALESLAFSASGGAALVGTLPIGYFDEIEWTADFYSGHAVLEVPGERRVTDLEPVEPEVAVLPAAVLVRAEVPTALGPLLKELRVHEGSLELRWAFSRWGLRPRASLRAGLLTLLDERWGRELHVTCANGGPRERFRLRGRCDHGRSVSSLVSASAAFGATDGWLSIDDGRAGLQLTWPQHEVAALPLVTCVELGEKRFVRVSFSLSEVDETHRPGAPLYDFRLLVRPLRSRP